MLDYFDRVLQKAQAGKDPFREPPRPRRRSTDAEAVDPDLETLGRVLEGSKLYFISALFIISSSCSLVLAQVILHSHYLSVLLMHCETESRRAYSGRLAQMLSPCRASRLDKAVEHGYIIASQCKEWPSKSPFIKECRMAGS